MVVDVLSGLGILAVERVIAFNFRTEGPYHWRMASHATFADVDVSSMEFAGCISLDACDGGYVRFNEKGGHHFDNAADQDCDQREESKQEGFALQDVVPSAG